MHIKKINIRNFRCFSEFEIDLASKATILYGKNGAGKTTLIHAIHKALSFMMYSENVYAKGKKGKREIVDVRTIANNNPNLHPEGFMVTDYNNEQAKMIEVCVSESRLDHATPLPDWKMSALAHTAKLRPSQFSEAFGDFYRWHTETGCLPLMAYYSDGFPHVEDRTKKTTKNKLESLRNFGYHDWNKEEGCTEIWLGKLESCFKQISQLEKANRRIEERGEAEMQAGVIESNLTKIHNLSREIKAIENCLINFSRELLLREGDFLEVASIIDGEEGIAIRTRGNREIPFRHLPAGYMRLFCIVLDMAYRSYILSNGQSTDIPGIAIIDELDLHLHPELEAVVLPKLMSSFPSVQFVISTHSILVLTGISTADGSCAIKMMTPNANGPIDIQDVYGLDYNSALQEVMKVKPNGAELRQLISDCAFMYENDLDDQANATRRYILSLELIKEQELDQRIREERNAIKG